MSPKLVTAIAIKFLALWLVVNILVYLPSLLITISRLTEYAQEQPNQSIYVFVTFAFVLLGSFCSVILFKVSNSVLKSVPEKSDTTQQEISQVFVLQLFGIYFLVSALIGLTGSGYKLSNTAGYHDWVYLQGAGYLFELFIGLYLVTKPKFWANFLIKLRGRA